MRWLLKAPLLLYRIGLAERAKDRFLLLTTTGRKTGRRHTCPLNYLQEGDGVYVFAGWGRHSDWYRNLLAHPQVKVQVGRSRWDGIATSVDDLAERQRVIACYQGRALDSGPPRPIRRVLRRFGLDYDALVRQSLERAGALPVVAIRPSPPEPAR